VVYSQKAALEERLLCWAEFFNFEKFNLGSLTLFFLAVQKRVKFSKTFA